MFPQKLFFKKVFRQKIPSLEYDSVAQAFLFEKCLSLQIKACVRHFLSIFYFFIK